MRAMYCGLYLPDRSSLASRHTILRRVGKSLLIWALGKAIESEVTSAMRGLIIAVAVILVIAVVAYFLLSGRRRP
jgi:membrane protein DedA with SNARE-associated domain